MWKSSLSFSIPLLPEHMLEGMGCSNLVLGTLVLFLLLETVIGRSSNRNSLALASYRTNFSALLLNDILIALLSVPSLLILAGNWALFHPIQALTPQWRLPATLVLLDLTLYLWHRTCHILPWLWWFHRVHHSDPFVNVTTAFRLHFLEILGVSLVKAAFVMVTGVSAELLLAADTLIVLWVMGIHANLNLAGERWLKWLFTVPSLHRLHHSVRRSEHDHNYGFLFSLWDRLLGTLAVGKPARIGLDGLVTTGWGALLSPLPLPQTNTQTGPAAAPVPLYRMIAEAAYYQAERRGFAPGFELEDWL